MKQYILMADIVSSGTKDQSKLMVDFKSLVENANKVFKKNILSPLTITLGDEFQGIIGDLANAIDLIIHLEEEIIHRNSGFQLRYVLNYGKIETPINQEIAYQMLGRGLTDARNILNTSKKENNRFSISIGNATNNDILNNAFIIYEQIISKWNSEKDYKLVSNLITLGDYKIVAQKMDKTRSQIWKREKTLNMESYHSIKKIMQLATRQV